MHETYTNLAGHPLTLDGGTVVASGEDVSAELLSGPLAKSEIESGHLVPVSTSETTRQRDVDYIERRQPPDFEAMTVEQLKDELEDRGLPTTGNKGDLVKRLRSQDETES